MLPLLTRWNWLALDVQGSYRDDSSDFRPAKVPRGNSAKSAGSKPAATTVRNMVPLKNMVGISKSSRGKHLSQSIEEIAAASSRVRSPIRC